MTAPGSVGGALYCWGENNSGNLGRPPSGDDDAEPDIVATPEPFGLHGVCQVAGGLQHSLLLRDDGSLHVCGCNLNGQLGVPTPPTASGLHTATPVCVPEAFDGRVEAVAAGEDHSVAVTVSGAVFCWGLNNYGQCGAQAVVDGQAVTMVPQPTRVPLPAKVVQVAAGSHHTLALTAQGALYAWGLNRNGQLGLGHSDAVQGPRLVSCLLTFPVVMVRSSGQVCAAVTRQGSVFTWGHNKHQILGEKRQPSAVPLPVADVTAVTVTAVALTTACMYALDVRGTVWVWGRGARPKAVQELMGSRVTQLACGMEHTLVVAGRKVWMLPADKEGRGPEKAVPVEVKGAWSVASTPSTPARRLLAEGEEAMEVEQAPPPDSAIRVRDVFCGSATSFVATCGDPTLCADYSQVREDQPAPLSPLSPRSASACPVACLQPRHLLHLADPHRDQSLDAFVISELESGLKYPSCWNNSFLLLDALGDKTQHNTDLAALSQFMQTLAMAPTSVRQRLYDAASAMVDSLHAPTTLETARVYLMLFYSPFLDVAYIKDKPSASLLARVAKCLINIPQVLKEVLGWIAQLPLSVMRRIVKCLVYTIELDLVAKKRCAGNNLYINDDMLFVYELLEGLYQTNSERTDGGIDCKNFYMENLDNLIDIRNDLVKTIQSDRLTAKLHTHYLFLYNAANKAKLLRLISLVKMYCSQRENTQYIFGVNFMSLIPVDQFLELTVRRPPIQMVADTITFLSNVRSDSKLLLPLRVRFAGEPGEDEGGLRKEFFSLIFPLLLKGDYGLFKEYDESRLLWFAEKPFEDIEVYGDVGMMCALVIYNNITVDLPFPRALFKLLLDKPVDINDLEELSPSLVRGLRELLSYDGDGSEEEALYLCFEREYECNGEVYKHELKENGGNIPVTKDNKKEYVELLVKSVLYDTVSDQFKQFYDGFFRVLGRKQTFMRKVFSALEAEELQALVAGSEDYDWFALKTNTTYKGEYNPTHEVIINFWQVFMEFSVEDKKKFLKFVTACDRVPIEGMASIKMVIQSTADVSRMPVAHTCANQLDLPAYRTLAKLRYKLHHAIQHNERFELV